MCFSASASFTASGILGVIGVLSLYEIRNKQKTALPCIFIPLFFSLQQGMEGITWLTHNQPDLVWLQQIASYGFLIIAIAVWPIWFPYSAYLLEKQTERKKWIFSIGILGCLTAIVEMYFFMDIGAGMNVHSNHISYVFFSSVNGVIPFNLLYCLAVIGPWFISKVKGMKPVGVGIGLGLIVSQIFYTFAMGSVWCFFAALSSMLIYRVARQLPPEKAF